MRSALDGPAEVRPSRTERGAIAVMVALLMIPMMAICALVVDLADLYAERQRLQTGADAAALAIASDCLRGACGTPAATASTFAARNLGGTGTSTATVTALTSNSVTVKNTATVKHLFASAIGVNSSSVGAQATATWDLLSPSAGTAVLPLVINACEYNLATRGSMPSGTTPRTLYLSGVSSGCYSAPGIPTSTLGPLYYQPGGFAWVKTTTGCKTASAVKTGLPLSSGSSVPSSSCTSSYFASLQNATVLLPISDDYSQPSVSNASAVTFSVYGYVGFHITGYSFGPGRSVSWNSPCNGSQQRCLHGYFTRMTDQASGFTYGGGAQLGAGAVQLTK